MVNQFSLYFMQSFSVLLSLYHKESALFLHQSLESVFAQTLLPTEVILVEDGPLSEELHAVVKEFMDRYLELKVIPLVENQGLGKALNEGLKHCSYDIVARMDTDDVAKPDRFEKQLAIFQEHPEVDVVGAWIDEFEGAVSNVLSVRKVPKDQEDILRFAKGRCPVNHPVVMFRKSAVLKAGGYKHFPLFEDYYLWVRMLMADRCSFARCLASQYSLIRSAKVSRMSCFRILSGMLGWTKGTIVR